MQAPIEFRFAETGPRQMGVRVDEARNRRPPLGIEILGDWKIGAALGPDVIDPPVAHDDDRFFMDGDFSHRLAADAGPADGCGNLREIANE